MYRYYGSRVGLHIHLVARFSSSANRVYLQLYVRLASSIPGTRHSAVEGQGPIHSIHPGTVTF